MEINERDVLAAYKDAGEDSKMLLEKLFGKGMFKTKPVTERIKTFEDACEELGYNHKFVLQYRTFKHTGACDCKDISAYLKLRIICTALNDGWKPKFTESEYRYYPHLILYTKKEVENIDENMKKRLCLGNNTGVSSRCGLIAAIADNRFGNIYTIVGSRLCLRTRELAEYCGRQFTNLWKDLYIGK